jgi:signal transduction histidine kinase
LPAGGRRRSLRNRVIHGLGLIVVLAVFLLAVGLAFFVYRAERASWQGRQAEAVDNAAHTVGDFLRESENDVALVGQLDGDYLYHRPEVLHSFLDQNPALLEVVRVDDQGSVIVSAHRGEPVLANLFTIPQSNWFLTARAGRSYTGQVQLSAREEPYLIMAAPAGDGGVTAVRLHMDVLWEAMSDVRFGRTGQAYVVTHQGEIVAHPDPQVVLARTSIAGRPEIEQARQAPDYRWRGHYYNFAGVQVVGSTAAIPDSEWIIFTEVARAEAFSITLQALYILGGGVALSGLLMTLAAVRLMNWAVFEPLKNLQEGARRFGRGDLAHRIPIRWWDEMGEVTGAFNDMADRLADREVALKQARDEALDASRFKSRLLANVGHDLRTPLNAILGYSEMLYEGVYGPMDEAQHGIMGRVLSNVRRLKNLVNSMLDQAQIDAGKLTLRDQPFSPAALFSEIETTMAVPALAKGLQLEVVIDAALPTTLIGDAQRIDQIATNLVENAIKFTAEGCVCLRLYPDGEAYWVLEVSDTGPGVDPEIRDYIFEPFRRGDDSSTRQHSGVGLGLSIVKQLVGLMGGEIHLDSRVAPAPAETEDSPTLAGHGPTEAGHGPTQAGHGSTFTVLLPLNLPEEAPS